MDSVWNRLCFSRLKKMVLKNLKMRQKIVIVRLEVSCFIFLWHYDVIFSLYWWFNVTWPFFKTIPSYSTSFGDQLNIFYSSNKILFLIFVVFHYPSIAMIKLMGTSNILLVPVLYVCYTVQEVLSTTHSMKLNSLVIMVRE